MMKLGNESKIREMRSSSDQLEIDNKNMEEKILALKAMMKQEKEQRIRNGGSRWKSSAVTSTIPETSLRRLKSAKKTTNKIKLLSNEPLSSYVSKRKSKENANIRFPCGQCENAEASSECIECNEYYCSSCYKNFHAKGALRKHTWRPVETDKRVNISEPYTSNARNTEYAVQETKDTEDTMEDGFERNAKRGITGGALLQGVYNEKESAASFAEALRNWRMSRSDCNKDSRLTQLSNIDKESRSCGTETGWTSKSARISSPSDVRLNFGSSLTYAERLALKKNKQDPAAFIGYRYPAQKKSNDLDPRLPLSPRGATFSKTPPSSKSGFQAMQLTSEIVQTSSNPARKTPKGSTGSPTNPKPDNGRQSQVLSIDHVLTLDDIPSGGEESISPVIDDNSNDENNDKKEIRQTLSQMGRLTIVELNFSDPEFDWYGTDYVRSKSAGVMLSPSNTPSPQNNNRALGSKNSKSKFTPRPPHHSAPGSYTARQKLLSNRSKQTGKQKDVNHYEQATASQLPRKGWGNVPTYTGLDEFFTAGVDDDRQKRSRESSVSISSGEVERDCPAEVTNSLLAKSDATGLWRPGSSLALSNAIPLNYEADLPHKNEPLLQNLVPEVTMTFETSGECKTWALDDDMAAFKGENTANPNYVEVFEESQDPKLLNSLGALTSPRISLSDYDFLQAPPPIPKGDNFIKVHRASTITIFGLSPQPPDLWNDDSEIELTVASPKRPASPTCVDQRDDDSSALEELSREVEMREKACQQKQINERTTFADWEEEELIIEDKDDGSGLSSPAETELHYEGDESSEEERMDEKDEVLKLH